jgi:hypothetical protein
MKQLVEITLTLSLWLDATMDEDAIATHVRTRLPHAFGEELTSIANPVDILDIREEAGIFGTEEP